MVILSRHGIIPCAVLAAAAIAGCNRRPAPVSALPPPVYRTEPEFRTIPPGRTLVFALVERVDAKGPANRKLYSAVVARDILNAEGKVLIGQGSPARLILLSSSPDRLEFGLHSVMVHGSLYPAVTAGRERAWNPSLGQPARAPELASGGAIPEQSLLVFTTPAPLRLAVPDTGFQQTGSRGRDE